MLQILSTGNSLPWSWIVDPSAQFEPGQVGQLTVIGNQIMVTVSDGTAPIGVIDDVKTKAFTAIAWNETVIVAATGVLNGAGKYVSTVDIKYELNNPNVSPSSFISIPVDVQLIPRNGVIVFPAGTELNFDLTGSGTPNAIKTIVNYSYQVPNVIGDDSTQGSSRCTIWFQRMLLSTDKFESNASYPINSNLFVSETGLFTTRQPTPNHPSVGIVTGSPSVLSSMLELMWL